MLRGLGFSCAAKSERGLTPKVRAVPAAAESLINLRRLGATAGDHRMHLSRMQFGFRERLLGASFKLTDEIDAVAVVE